MDAAHALDLPAGRETFVEAFHAERPPQLVPRGEALFPALDAAFGRLGVSARQIGARAHHGLEGDGPGHHVVVVAPGLAPYVLRRLEKIADDAVIALLLAIAVRGALDFFPVGAHPAVQLVEQLRLQYLLVLQAAAAQAVDAVPERTVGLAVEILPHARREALVGVGPRYALVQVHQMAFVDAGRGRIDDDEHLGREVLAAPVEDHARHVDAAGLRRVLFQVEVQGRQPVLAIDDQIFFIRLLQVADVLVAAERGEAQCFRGKKQHGAGDRRLAHRHFVEILERPHLGARELALESLVGMLDARDELRDLVVLRNRLRRDLLAFAVVAADETHLVQGLPRRAAREIKNAVLLAYPCCKHDAVSRLALYRF